MCRGGPVIRTKRYALKNRVPLMVVTSLDVSPKLDWLRAFGSAREAQEAAAVRRKQSLKWARR